jgi:uncharacterized protein
MRYKICAAWLLASVLVAPTWALSLDDAKQQGLVGERANGYVGPVNDSPPATDLVRHVNQERRRSYQELAERNGVSVDAVANLAGHKLIERAQTGEYVDDGNGWRRK